MTIVSIALAASTLVMPPTPGGPTELRWTVRLRDKTAVPRSLAATLDGSAAFAAWAEDPPRCLFDPGWTHAKVFVRGEGGLPVRGVRVRDAAARLRPGARIQRDGRDPPVRFARGRGVDVGVRRRLDVRHRDERHGGYERSDCHW